eukprot:CAMPEP_0198208818 /NCGR_PEP_ID=MMETSP1445-20131203/12162_1 /TAXON_ID=36898 /ORGANISM="Pyramimonas sp., Strain CCMP2087" /LENGTH=348 /DNA_ID=CAMNT_0043882369 /DNA_START=22 /DNA_END=1064 /DNA_ORIENTATION=-
MAKTSSQQVHVSANTNDCVPGIGFLDVPLIRTLQGPPCVCGNYSCHALDNPSKTFILFDFSKVDDVRDVLKRIFDNSGRGQDDTALAEVLIHDPYAKFAEPAFLRMLQQLPTIPHYRGEFMEAITLVSTGDQGLSRDVLKRTLVRASNSDTIHFITASEINLREVPHDFAANSRSTLLQEEWEACVSEPGADPSTGLLFPVKPNRNINHLTEEARSIATRKDPLVSFVIQYFKRPTLVESIIKRLEKVKLSRGVEVLINIDSMSEHAEWNRVLQNGEFRRYYLVTSGNVHEIRGYNRLAKMAEGEFVVFMQDDDLPPAQDTWLRQAASLFKAHADLSLLGGYTGKIQG